MIDYYHQSSILQSFEFCKITILTPTTMKPYHSLLLLTTNASNIAVEKESLIDDSYLNDLLLDDDCRCLY